MKGHLRVSNGIKLKSPIGYFSRPTTSRVREAVMNIIRYSLLLDLIVYYQSQSLILHILTDLILFTIKHEIRILRRHIGRTVSI